MHLVLFDIDGTLIRGDGMGRKAMERAFAQVFKRDPTAHPAVRDVHYAGSTDPDILADLARAFDVPTPEFHERHEDLRAAYLRHLERTVADDAGKHACPGVTELLPLLHHHPRITLGLLTGNMEQGARIKLEPFGFNSFFPLGGFGGDGKERKDLAARAVVRASQHTGERFDRSRVMVVGDTIQDVQAGAAHGFLTAAVATGWTKADRLRKERASRVFTDLTPPHGFADWIKEQWGVELGPA